MIRNMIREAIQKAQAEGRNNVIRGSFRQRDCWGESSIRVGFFKSFGSMENLEVACWELQNEMFEVEQERLEADNETIIEEFRYEFNGVPCTLEDIKSFI